MKTATYLFIFLIIAICVAPTSAKIWIVDNTGENPLADYTTISDAHNAALPGDSIYIYGSATNYGTLSLAKKIYIFGTGYFLDENPETQANILSSTVSSIAFLTNSEGSMVTGLKVTSSGSYAVSFWVSNIIFQKNLVFGDDAAIKVYPGNSNILITQNYLEKKTITSRGVIEFSGQNCIISNNFISANSANVAINFIDIDAFALVENNLIKGNVKMQLRCTFRNNILISGNFDPTGCIYTNNIGNADQFGDLDGNKSNEQMSTVFVDSASNSTDSRWQLATDSPAIGAGFGGTNCGMFGGDFPYVLSGLPSIPTIYYFEAPLRGAQNQGLDVTIKVKSVN